MPPSDLTLADQLADEVVSHQVDLLRLEADLQARALSALRELEDEIAACLYAADLASDASGPALTTYARHRLQALLTQIRETVRSAYGDLAAPGALLDLAAFEASFAAGLLAPINVAIETSTVALAPAQLRAILSDTLIEGAPSAEWWSRQAGDLVERFADAMRQGLLAGETNDQLVRRIRGDFAGWVDGARTYSGGVMDATTLNAMSLVRTSAQAVAAAARRETFRENQDVVKGIAQLSTLDSKTTLICIAYHREAWLFPDMQPIGKRRLPYNGGLPRHWGERSAETPVLKSWRELGIERPEGQPPSDGAGPNDLDMDTFLGRRTTKQQDEQLGAGRAAMWRAGEITLGQLLDQRGNSLTFAELVAKYGR
jgi:hypothetical protein